MKKVCWLLLLCLILMACGGKQEIPEVLTFADADFEGVNSIDILNCHNGKVTQIIYPDQIAEITAFLQQVRGVSPESGKGYSEGSYELTLKAGFDTVLSLAFGDSDSVFVGGENSVRYTLEGMDIQQVLEFFANYHNDPIPVPGLRRLCPSA